MHQGTKPKQSFPQAQYPTGTKLSGITNLDRITQFGLPDSAGPEAGFEQTCLLSRDLTSANYSWVHIIAWVG